MLISCHFAAGSPVMVSDTARMNSMAMEIRALLKDKSKIHQADSLLHSAYQLTSGNKEQFTPLLHWAAAELALYGKDYGNAYKSAAQAMKSPMKELGMQAYGELSILFAKTCQYTGNFSLATEVLEKNIEFARSNHLKHLLPASYLGLSEVYSVLQKPEETIRALEQVLAAAEQEKDITYADIANNRLGVLRLTYKRDFSVVDRYFKKSLELNMKIADSSKIAYSLTNIAWNFYLEKQLDSSLFYYNLSLTYSLPTKGYSRIANSYGNIGTIYRDLKEYDRANAAWTKGIEAANIIHDWYTLSWIYNDMSLMAANTGDYKNAYEYQLLYKQYSDSLGSQKYSEGLSEARTQFDFDNQEKELQLLSLRLKNQRLLIYGFAGFLLLSLTIGILLLMQSKMKARRRISEMDQKILEVTQANLRQQMNPHFIFNTLNSIQYYMYKHDKLATNNYLTKFSSLMRKILENSQHTAIPVRDELDALELYLELESIRFRDKFDYQISVDDEIDPLMYKIPTMLIQPFVENAICHGLMLREDKGLVTVSLTLEEDYLSCRIEDNGIGREASREINLKKQHTHSSLGTQITESRLKLVNEFYGKSLKTIYTDLKDDHGMASGTRVEIHIPILT